MLNEKSHKCTNCGKEIWLGAFFDGYFLCELCHQNAAYIIFRLRKRLTKRAADVMPCGHPLVFAYQGEDGGTYCRVCESA